MCLHQIIKKKNSDVAISLLNTVYFSQLGHAHLR